MLCFEYRDRQVVSVALIVGLIMVIFLSVSLSANSTGLKRILINASSDPKSHLLSLATSQLAALVG